MAANPIRFGVIGTSGHGNRVATPTIKGNANTILVGGAGGSYERSQEFAQRHGAGKAYASVDEMLQDSDIDAVWICSPNYMHGADAQRVVAAGKHALVEKPLSIKLADAEAALATAQSAEKNGVVLKVGFQHRFRPSHRRIKELLQEDRIGTLGYVRIHRFWPWPYYADSPPMPPAWRQSLETSGGFVTNDLGSHLIDLAQWFAGAHGDLIGAAMASQKYDIETEDSSALLMSLGTAAIGLVEASSSNISPDSRFEIYGTGGWIRADGTLTGVGRVTTSDGLEEHFETIDHLLPYAGELSDFIAAIRGEPSIGANVADATANVRIIASASQNGKRMRTDFAGNGS